MQKEKQDNGALLVVSALRCHWSELAQFSQDWILRSRPLRFSDQPVEERRRLEAALSKWTSPPPVTRQLLCWSSQKPKA
jgi:hypothetical protein